MDQTEKFPIEDYMIAKRNRELLDSEDRPPILKISRGSNGIINVYVDTYKACNVFRITPFMFEAIKENSEKLMQRAMELEKLDFDRLYKDAQEEAKRIF